MNPHSPTDAPLFAATAAAHEIARRSGRATHELGVILGSGWGATGDGGTSIVELDTSELPGFHPPAVAGHAGSVRSMRVGGRDVLVFSGRTHLYEGHGVDAVVHAVRVIAASGCRGIVLTNGCGSVRPEWEPGTVVVLRDHINLTGTTPLVGATFIDMSATYSPRMRAVAHEAVPGLDEGVYAQFRGPQYETPAEVHMAAVLGADLVGMSTALEAIEARRYGLEVLGLSLVTNHAAGVGTGLLDHADVLATGRSAGGRLQHMLERVISNL